VKLSFCSNRQKTSAIERRLSTNKNRAHLSYTLNSMKMALDWVTCSCCVFDAVLSVERVLIFACEYIAMHCLNLSP
jgi:hypothetical protein